jgi:hypothetical protein
MAVVQVVSRGSVIAEVRVRSQNVCVRYVVDKVALGLVFLRVRQFYPGHYISFVYHLR